MAAYEVLLNREVNTFTKFSDYFNGLLSDYLEEADCPAEHEQFFRELLEEGDDLRLEVIEDDAVFEKVSAAFDELASEWDEEE